MLARLLDWVPKPAARWSRLFGLGALVGILGGLAAAALEAGLHYGAAILVERHDLPGSAAILRPRALILLLPALGGLLSGIVVYSIFRLRPGHGTDILVRAFHHNMGTLALKSPLVKGAAAVGVISCGGSAGPEGPIAAIGAAIGSSIGRAVRVSPRERRALLVAGCGAGIGAIFSCPLGGALFAASVLYRELDFEKDALVPAFVASVLGSSVFLVLWGSGGHVLPGTTELHFESPVELLPYCILGPACGALSLLFGAMLRSVEHGLLPRSRLPRWLAPAVGGLLTGLLACLVPQVMDGQYQFVKNAMTGGDAWWAQHPGWSWWSWAGLFGAVALAKCLATALTVGSGASGGVLGPSIFIGGATGACLGAVCEAILPDAFPEHLRQALIPVGMAGFLAAGMRTPLAAIVMVIEMTGSYGLVIPLMLVCVSAYVVGRRGGLNPEQVATAAESPAHAGDVVIHLLEGARVERIMHRSWPMTASPETSIRELIAHMQPGTRPVFAIARGDRLLGVVSVPDIQDIMNDAVIAENLIAADIMTERLETVAPDDDLYEALTRFTRSAHDVLPVVSRDRRRRWVGMLTREQVFESIRAEIEKMHRLVLREHAGLAAFDGEGQLQQLVMGVAPVAKGRIQRLLVPLHAVGKSIRQADFRRAFGATIIAIERPDGTILSPPDIDLPLATGMRLLAIVEHAVSGNPQEDAPS